MKKNWSFAWRMSFRATGWLLALIAGALLFVRVIIGLSGMELPGAMFASFELIVPLVAGLHAALLFAPDDEPALELLLASPRPPIYLMVERLVVMLALQGGLALALSAFAALTTQGANLLSIIVIWLPPAVCMVGLCLLATVYARRMAFGVLVAIVVAVGMGVGREVILPVFPKLWFLIFYLDPRMVTAEAYLINRLFLMVVGGVALALVIYRMRDEEALLGFQEAKSG